MTAQPSGQPSGIDRRRLLRLGASAAGLAAGASLAGASRSRAATPSTPTAQPTPAPTPSRSGAVPATPRLRSDPFTLGVASGDPAPDGMVLWTRLAPEPLTADGGMPARPFPLEWEVAADPQMRCVLRRDVTTVGPQLAHSAHVIVDGLGPAREYWYRFRAGQYLSPVGRTKTLPDPGSSPRSLLFAAVSCQHYEMGYYAAFRHLAAEHVDLVFHLGDYIYEGGQSRGHLRRHASREPVDLAAYRVRYGQYKSDPDLIAAHASAPFAVTWDDHEVENDYAGDSSQDFRDPAVFHRRRAAAYQAYYEHLPLRQGPPGGDWAGYRLYRRLQYGDLASFSILDTRQYRDDQPCGLPGHGGNRQVDTTCTQRTDPRRTMLGAGQLDWLQRGLAASPTRWNVVAQEYLMAELDRRPGPGVAWATDAWDGYAGERTRLLRFLGERRVRNAVTLGGDIHTAWVTDLHPDFRDPRSPVVATEFVATSITSAGWDTGQYLADNPHVRYAGDHRGYLRCTVTPGTWRADLRSVGAVALRDAPVRTVASFTVEDGRPGAHRT